MSQNFNKEYFDDIINLPTPTSKKHPRMSMEARAAQFSPFSALTGLNEAMDNTRKLHVENMKNLYK